jgi:N-acetylglucosamine-6-sulfatase
MDGMRGRGRRPGLRRGAAPVVALLTLALAPGCSEVPTAVDATVVTIARPTPITLAAGDPAGGGLTWAVSPPAHGRLDGPPPTVLYTPASGFVGTDSFTFTATSASGAAATGTVTVTVKRPNVVVVMTDDQRLDQQQFLPKTNELIGRQGTTFANYVVSYSECCPSRATFLSGQYAHNHQVLSSAGDTGGATKFKDGSTLATWLQGSGYFTAMAGKYLNGYGGTPDGFPTPTLAPTYVPPGWSDWLGLVEPRNYDFYDYQVNDNGRVVDHGRAPEDYSTDMLFGRTESLIRTKGGTATPLFLVVTPTAPHVTNGGGDPLPAARHEQLFYGLTAPRTPAFDQPDVSTMPSWIAGKPRLDAAQVPAIDRLYRAGARSLQAVDEGVEKLYRALQDTGELDNTVFVYTSDNGFHYGDHRIPVGKSDQYDETLRVPLLVRGPYFPAGRTVTQPVANVDLAPTISAVARVAPGLPADGVPLFPFVNRPGYGTKRSIVIENGPLWGRITWSGVRDDRWVYIVSSNGERELYDLAKDPYETVNRVSDPNAVLAVLNADKRLKELKACAGVTCQAGLTNATNP